jgi:hypothetical protein
VERIRQALIGLYWEYRIWRMQAAVRRMKRRGVVLWDNDAFMKRSGE